MPLFVLCNAVGDDRFRAFGTKRRLRLFLQCALGCSASVASLRRTCEATDPAFLYRFYLRFPMGSLATNFCDMGDSVVWTLRFSQTLPQWGGCNRSLTAVASSAAKPRWILSISRTSTRSIDMGVLHWVGSTSAVGGGSGQSGGS
ncbi:hypothetical protein ECG_01128 [Echinococcus granulosus]|nr:hypothetical protein ECG_01128 [Echinococcus granulosus]